MPLVLCKEEARPNHPGGSGPQGLEAVCAPITVLAPATLPLCSAHSFLQCRTLGTGLRSPMYTRISMMGTYMGPTWTMHAACVYLRSNACCVYTLATCTGHSVYTMDLAHEVRMCACVCLPRHKHGACHMEMHMHVALHRATLFVGAGAHAWMCAHRHHLLACTLRSMNVHTCPLHKTFCKACRRHTRMCTLILVQGVYTHG